MTPSDREAAGQRIARARRLRGLSQAVLAGLAGATRTARSSRCAPPSQPPARGAERQHPDLTPQQGSSETARMGDLTVQRQAFRAAMNEHRQPVPGEASPAARTPWRDAILQPPKPQITPSAEILQVAAEHDSEHEAGG
jgi:hypothetical protein